MNTRKWCEEFEGRKHTGVLLCRLNNHAVKIGMHAVYTEGKYLKQEQHFRYLWIHFDKGLSEERAHVGMARK